MTATLAAWGAITPFAATATWATFFPRSNIWGPVISRGAKASGKVALTFDDGPTPRFTDRVLDVLKRYDVRATFFIIGENAQQYPDLLRRAHGEGHLIANHTWSHPHYGFLRGVQYWLDQIRRTDALIESLTESYPRFLRPPLGFRNVFTMRAARQLQHSVIAWSRRPFDGLTTTADVIVRRLEPTRAGDIVLLHDGVAPNHPSHDPSPTVAALDTIVANLLDRGLQPVSLSDGDFWPFHGECGPPEDSQRNQPAQHHRPREHEQPRACDRDRVLR